MKEKNTNWTNEDSLHTYQIKRWGENYFGINAEGELSIYPNQKLDGMEISIQKVIEEAQNQGVSFPAVFRFHDILRSQVKHLNESFIQIINEAGFKGKYFGVFPIKVNQLREVVEEIIDVGQEYNYGLEAGSKPELLAALAYNTNAKSLTVLNGNKDEDYIRLAMLGCKMGKKIAIVIEKFSEIHHVLKLAQLFKVEPIIGVRAKLSTKSSGKWAESSGDFAKFGLTIPEIVDLVSLLKEKNKLHLLSLFHFHVGSQIPDIRIIKECITEGARIYTNLIKMGVQIEYFDVGGGVGVNYDGTRSNTCSSINYTLKDYIGDVVYILKDICDLEGIKHPHIVTETGRAVCAHHSCVITNVYGDVGLDNNKSLRWNTHEDDHLILKHIKQLHTDLNQSNYQDTYNNACIIKDETISAFKLGVIDLEQRSSAELIYWDICSRIISLTENEKYVPEEIKKLKTVMAEKYLCNFSLFQSAPDTWAIEQLLPIVPINRLNTKPTKECTLADITCDSDGKINNFLSPEGHKSTLTIHELPKNEKYFIGLFLTGAYQDIMGDMHNLFGRLNEVHIYSDENDPSNFYIEEIIHGNSAADVLEIMQYNPAEMSRKIKVEIDKKIKTGEIKPRTGVSLVDYYEACLYSYTYLN
ncbi:MAG: biosynthetic arginine decarboxylase [Halobacteriovoraceae bacterium]|jgi:arginine decarboxylase|nr:biosynthetic arginine decarboxylase [Halobacteriovoraceae bacterium]